MASSMHSDYEYINEDQIDVELKCGICHEPFENPVSLLGCNHTFCRKCIRPWLKTKNTCPTCRKVFEQSKHYPYTQVNTPIVSNQLGRLLIRCSFCNETNIQRSNWESHGAICTKKIVQCTSADIKCPWVGSRDKLTAHLEICAFKQVHPIIDDLKQSIDLLENQMSFLLKMINHGNLMSSKCNKGSTECKYQPKFLRKKRFACSICKKSTSLRHIALHSCNGGCICQSCVDRQYPVYEEKPDPSNEDSNHSSDDDDDDDDDDGDDDDDV